MRGNMQKSEKIKEVLNCNAEEVLNCRAETKFQGISLKPEERHTKAVAF